MGKRGEVGGDDFSSPLLCSREWRPGFVGGWMIWLPGRLGEQAGQRSKRKEGGCLPLSYYLAFFYFLFIIRRENLEDVRDFVLYWKGEAKLVRQPDGDAD